MSPIAPFDHLQRSKMTRSRAAIRITLFSLMGFAVLLLLIFALLQLGPVKGAMGEVIGSWLGSRVQLEIKVEGIGGVAPFWLNISRITIDDRKGRLCEIRGVRVRPAFPSLRRPISFGLYARRVDLLRLPSRPAQGPSKGLSIPRVTIPAPLQAVRIRELALEKDFIGRPMLLSLNAQLSPDGRGGRIALGTPKGQAEAVISWSQAAQGEIGVKANVSYPIPGHIKDVVGIKQALTLDVRLEGMGPPSAWRGRLRLTLDPLGDMDASILLSLGEAPYLEVSGRWLPKDDRRAPPSGLWILGREASFHLLFSREGRGLPDLRAQLEWPLGVILNASGSLHQGGLVRATAELSIHQPGALSAALGLPVKLLSQVEVQLEGLPKKGDLRAVFRGTVSLPNGGSGYMPWKSISFGGRASLNSANTMEIEEFSLEAPSTEASLSGTFTISDRSLDLHWNLLSQIHKDQPPLLPFSTLEGSGTIKGTFSRPYISANLEADQIHWMGIRLQGASLSLTSSGPPWDARGEMKMEIKAGGQRFTGETTFKLGKTQLTFSPLILYGPVGEALNGEVFIQWDNGVRKGQIKARLPGLLSISRALGWNIDGRALLAVDLYSKEDALEASMRMEGSGIILPFGLVEQFTLRGRLHKDPQATLLTLMITSGGIIGRAVSLGDPEMLLKASLERISLKGSFSTATIKMGNGGAIWLEGILWEGALRWNKQRTRASGWLVIKRRNQHDKSAGQGREATVDLRISMQITPGEKLAVRADVSGLGAQPLQLQLHLPLKGESTPPRISLVPDGPLAGSLTGPLEVKALRDWIQGLQPTLTGSAFIDVRLTGTVSAPAIQGRLKIEKAEFQGKVR